jgi:hypothetical protein
MRALVPQPEFLASFPQLAQEDVGGVDAGGASADDGDAQFVILVHILSHAL